ncbi:hypothetical protein KA005_68735 [bacterium]|nr:hypothetical protein [bacterium]
MGIYDLRKYFTGEGVAALRVKLETGLRFYNEEEKEPVKYPLDFRMLGFPQWLVDSREELKGRVIELAHLLNLGLKEETIKEKKDGEEIRIKKLKIKEKNGS